MPAAIRRPASLVSDRAMTQNVISPGRNVATPAARLISSHCGGRIDETETRFGCSMSATRTADSNAVSAWRCTPTPWVRNTLLGNGNIVPSTSPWIARRKALVAPSFFPCLIPQQACDTRVRRPDENLADSGQDVGAISRPADAIDENTYYGCSSQREGPDQAASPRDLWPRSGRHPVPCRRATLVPIF